MSAAGNQAVHLTLPSADAIIETVTTATRINDVDSVWHHLTRHDFNRNPHLELRAVPRFGFGGKLVVTPHTDNPVTVVCYPEHLDSYSADQATLAAVNTALADIDVHLEPVTITAIADRDGTIHRRTDEPGDDLFAPVACGQGIVYNAGPITATVTCIPCRILPDRLTVTAAYFDLVDELSAAATKTGFPNSRAGSAANQTGNANWLHTTGNIRKLVREITAGGVPAGTFPDTGTASYAELVDVFIRHETGAVEAHGPRTRSRFPHRQQLVNQLDRIRAALDCQAPTQ